MAVIGSNFRVSLLKCVLNRSGLSAPGVAVFSKRTETSVSHNIEKSNDNNSSSDLLLSESCVEQLKKRVDDGSFLRVFVEGGGCSGFQYKFDLDKVINDDDKVFERDGAKVVVDTDSLEFIKGSVINYHEELIRSAFQIEANPNADQACSCGVSFNLKS